MDRHSVWWRRAQSGLFRYLPLAVGLVVLLFPFYWMVVSSLKYQNDLFDFSRNPLWVYRPTLENYRELLRLPLFARWFFNSATISLATTAISLVMSVMAGYALGRLRFRGAGLLGVLVFVSYLIPKTLLFIPMAQLMGELSLLGRPLALLLSFPTFLIPFCTWLLMGYFRSIPYELEECALIDGATRLQILWRITLPLAVPGLISAGIFAFTLSWNEFIYALAFIQSAENKTVPVAILTQLVEGDVYHWGSLMAGALLGSIPVAIFYSFFVEYYVSSLTGAVKE